MSTKKKLFISEPKRIFGLDILRAFAIVLVVMGHGKFILKDTALEGFPFFRMIDGVDIFFVLSGFLIGGILLKKLNEKDQFGFWDLGMFWKRRWFRTLPNYYLILFLNYVIVNAGIINEDIEQFNFHFLTFTQNFKDPFYGFFWESWSLSIEEWFYLITPVLILLLSSLLSFNRAYLIATILMIFLPLVYRFYQFDPAIDSFAWDIGIRKTVLSRLDSIGYGLFAAWMFFHFKALWNRWFVLFSALGLALIAYILLSNKGIDSIYMQTIYFSLVPLSVMFLLPLFTKIKSGRGMFAHATEHISKISYSMYLINLALVAEVIRDNFAPQGGWDGLLKYLIYWLVVVGVSTLLYRYFEKPLMDLREVSFREWFGKKS